MGRNQSKEEPVENSEMDIDAAIISDSKSPATGSRLRRPDPDIPDLSPETAEVLARINGKHTQSEWSRESSAAMSISSMGSSTSAKTGQKAQAQSPVMDINSGNQQNGSDGQVNLFERRRFDRSKLASAFASALAPKASILPSQGATSPKKASVAISRAEEEKAPRAPSPDSDSVVVVASPSREAQRKPNLPIASPKSSFSRPARPSMSANGGSSFTASPSARNLAQTAASALRQTQSQTPDGSPLRTHGKGLGRGRPGIKRGPRLSTILKKRKRTMEEDGNDTDESRDPKRKQLSATHVKDDDDESASDSESYTPQATQTKSGRQVHRPSTFVPPESPASASKKRGRQSDANTSPSVAVADGPASATGGEGGTPKIIKRKVYGKGKEQQALCEHCLRGYGPTKNLIVFCDGCNRAWHQKCHMPWITDAVVKDKDGQWFCKDCSTVMAEAIIAESVATEAKGLGKQDMVELTEESVVKLPETAATETSDAPATATTVQQSVTEGVSDSPKANTSMVAHPEWSVEQRESYFRTLTHEQLVSLLVQATTLHSSLPVFEMPPAPAPAHAPASVPSAPLPTVTTTTPTTLPAKLRPKSQTSTPLPPPASSTLKAPPPSTTTTTIKLKLKPKRNPPPPPRSPSSSTSSSRSPSLLEDHSYTYSLDEHLPLYPKPGFGVVLPPEKEDMDMLLEGAECQTFSHAVWPFGRERDLAAATGMGKGGEKVAGLRA